MNQKVGSYLFFYLFIFKANVHFAMIIHHQHRFYNYIERKKAEITDCHCELIIFVLLMSDHQFLFGFVFPPFFSFEYVEKVDSRECGVGVTEVRSGYSQHT